MRRRTRGLMVLLAALVIPGALGAWLLGTQSGTRFLVERATPYLPDSLTLSGVSGTVIRGLSLDAIEWRDETIEIIANAVFVDVRALPLVSRNVIIDQLDVAALSVRVGDTGSEPAETTDGLPEVRLPVDLRILDAGVRRISIETVDFKREIQELALAGRLAGSDLTVQSFRLASDWLDLDIAGSSRLAGRYRTDVAVDWTFKEVPEQILSGTLTIDGNLRGFDIEHQLQTPVSVSTDGVITFRDETLRVDIRSRWETIEWPVDTAVATLRDGRLDIVGDLAAVELTLGTFAGWPGYPEQELALRGTATTDGLRIDSLAAESPLGQAKLTGELSWQPTLSASLDVDLSSVDLAYLLPDMQSALAASASVDVAGADNISVALTTLSGELNGYAVDGEALMRTDGRSAQVDDSRLRIGTNRLQISGSVADTLSLVAEIDAGNVAELLPAASGAVVGRLSLQGSRSAPSVQFDLSGTALGWTETASVKSLSASGLLSLTGDSQAELSALGVRAGDRDLGSLTLGIDGTTEQHSVRASLEGFDSRAELELSGALIDQQWNGELRTLGLEVPQLQRFETRSPARLAAAADTFSVNPVCLFRDDTSACVSAARDTDGRIDFRLELVALALSDLPLPAEVTPSGELFVDLSGYWDGETLTADSRLELREGTINILYDEDPVDVVVSKLAADATVRRNALAFDLQLALENTAQASVSLGIADLFDTQSSIDGRTVVSVPDISGVATLVPGITEPAGTMSGTLVLDGTLAAPEFSGDVRLHDGRFDVRAAGTTITDVNLQLTQLGPGQLRVSGSARSGEGGVAVTGRTLVSTDSGIRSEFSIDGENFELAKRPDLSATASPDIDIVFDNEAILISGDLSIPSASIRLREIPTSAASASPDTVIHRQDNEQTAVARRIDIDVGTSLGDDVSFSGFGLTTQFDGGVRIRGGNAQAYTGQGRVSLRGGEYKAYGQELEIEEGELIFSGPLENPRLNVRAVRRVEDIVAGISLSGTPLQLQSTLYSDPTLTDAETLSYLLTGRPLSGSSDGDDSELLNQAAFSLGLSGAGAIVSRVRSSLGLETLAIEGRGDSSRLIAGKRIGNRLLVEYGYGVVDQLGTLLLRYQLSDRLVLESRTGSVSNLDLLYSVKKQ
ncbi:MAG: translocation/assembly module TamB domain-containing protein [Pseudomonadota bacterium]